MTGDELFHKEDMKKVMYQYIYTRRPDGQFFTEGDCYFYYTSEENT